MVLITMVVNVENPIVTKSKGLPKESRSKGGVKASKKPRHSHVLSCGGTNNDSQNSSNKKKNFKHCLLDLLISKF